jgi:hypothetical protein
MNPDGSELECRLTLAPTIDCALLWVVLLSTIVFHCVNYHGFRVTKLIALV